MSSQLKRYHRGIFRGILKKISHHRRVEASKLLHQSFIDSIGDSIIGSFCSLPNEISTDLINLEWAQSGQLALPKIRQDSFIIEYYLIPKTVCLKSYLIPDETYGIWEPDPHANGVTLLRGDQLSMILIPALAFDKHHNRLGKGLGYYDRFLKMIPDRTPKIGVGYKEQMTYSEIPTDNHDVPMNDVLLF